MVARYVDHVNATGFGALRARRGGDVQLLLTNDDGIDAQGLGALQEHMSGLGTVWVVAPKVEQSAKSHGFSLHRPVRVEERGLRRWAVTGTPADCTYLALHQVLPHTPDLVISGINHGSNLGTDVLYSGTVAAAMEACIQGVPALAVSLHSTPGQPLTHFDTAAELAGRVALGLRDNPLPPRVCLNLNVPDVPLDQLRGLRVCAQGFRHYSKCVDARVDPRGKAYYWLGGAHESFDPVDGTDGPLMDQGYATLTPLRADLTHHRLIDGLAAWAERT